MSDDSTASGAIAPVYDSVVFVGTGPIAFDGVDPITFTGPGSPDVLDDDGLDDFFQELVVQISGLPAQLVRPRWQVDPPNLPARDVNWAAVAVVSREHEQYAYIEHDPIGEGFDRLTRNETLTVVGSFYGPRCQGIGGRFRDGLFIAQNREVLLINNMGLKEVSDLQRAPEVIKDAWYNRADVSFLVSRQIVRTYPVRSLQSAVASLRGGPLTINIITQEG
jgi:hypothetical protein